MPKGPIFTRRTGSICSPVPRLRWPRKHTRSYARWLRALGHHIQKGETYDAITEEFVEDVIRAEGHLSPNYLFNIRDNATKEDYNAMHEQISAAEYDGAARSWRPRNNATGERERKKVDQVQQQAVIDYHKNHISDLSKYLK